MCQGHQNEFRITLEDNILEKIVMIWTPAKMMKKSPTPAKKRRLPRDPPRRPMRRQGHHNEFWSTLDDKLLEKIVIISTPAKA